MAQQQRGRDLGQSAPLSFGSNDRPTKKNSIKSKEHARFTWQGLGGEVDQKCFFWCATYAAGCFTRKGHPFLKQRAATHTVRHGMATRHWFWHRRKSLESKLPRELADRVDIHVSFLPLLLTSRVWTDVCQGLWTPPADHLKPGCQMADASPASSCGP